MKIAVYTISKNEEQFVKRCMDSARDADLFILCDTGSSDNTLTVAKEHGALAHEICITPWRFDHARNASLSLVPRDVDVCVSIDIDEVLEPGWRGEVERVFSDPSVTRMFYPYAWSRDVTFNTEKIHRRHGYYWKFPCHETLAPDPRIIEKFGRTDRLLVTHLPDSQKSRSQYLDLLAVGATENPDDSRVSFYYARELTFYSRWEEAERELHRYLSLPSSNWGAERSFAWRLLGDHQSNLGNYDKAYPYYQNAVKEAPDRRDPWVSLSKYYYHLGEWSNCLNAAKKALLFGESSKFWWPVDPVCWGPLVYDLAAIASWNLKDFSSAVAYGEMAVNRAPGDLRLLNNLQLYRSHFTLNKNFK